MKLNQQHRFARNTNKLCLIAAYHDHQSVEYLTRKSSVVCLFIAYIFAVKRLWSLFLYWSRMRVLFMYTYTVCCAKTYSLRKWFYQNKQRTTSTYIFKTTFPRAQCKVIITQSVNGQSVGRKGFKLKKKSCKSDYLIKSVLVLECDFSRVI